MIKTFFIFSFIFFFKSMVLSFFYSNYLMYLIYPLELAGLSLVNNNITLTDNNLSHLNTYLRWVLINWIGISDDYNVLNEIDNQETSHYVFILSWLLAFTFYQIYYVVHSKIIKKEKLNKINWLNYNIKYLLINYFSFFLWNLFIVFNLNDMIFWIALINILIFNFITFWIPGLIFYYVYGERLYFYRKNMNFLINGYNLQFKYFTITLLALKSLSGFFVLFYYFYPIESKFLLLFFNLIFYYIFKIKRVFIKVKNEFTILPLISSLIILLSILENYFPISYAFIVTKYIFSFIYILILIYYYNKNKQFETITEENIEMDIIV